MASLRETNHIETSFVIEDEPINTNPVPGSSCVHSDCEGNENEVHIAETVEENMLLDDWLHHDGQPFANETFSNNTNNNPTVGGKEKDVAPISVLLYRTIQGHYLVNPLVCLFDRGSSCSLLNLR